MLKIDSNKVTLAWRDISNTRTDSELFWRSSFDFELNSITSDVLNHKDINRIKIVTNLSESQRIFRAEKLFYFNFIFLTYIILTNPASNHSLELAFFLKSKSVFKTGGIVFFLGTELFLDPPFGAISDSSK